jgi:biopolymer transport protein ExbD
VSAGALGVRQLADAPFLHHLSRRARKRKGAKKNLIVGLTLTSMVDMFSLLVIFLLQTFSASPELLVGKGILLPSAVSAAEIKDALMIAISPDGVFLDQKRIGDLKPLLHDPAPLMSALEDHKNLWMRSHPAETFKGEITIQADRSTSSLVMSQFMSMLPSQNYGSMQLAVISGGVGGK